MDRGLYIAASGMLAEQIRQDQIANDLANASTPGYKGDRTAQRTFGDLLLASTASGQAIGSQSTAVQVDRIVTAQGDPVLDRAGRPIAVGGGKVDPRRLGVTTLTDPVKQGDSLVTGTPAGAAAGEVRAGALEGSGADAARAMVDMISSMRAFEAGQKVIQAIDETLGKAVTKVGAVGS